MAVPHQAEYRAVGRRSRGRYLEVRFHPEYAESDRYKAVASHYGRHRFTTYWQVHEDVNAELVHYMRGDEAGTSVEEGAMYHYIHTYFEDIENLYRERIFKLNV